jgi:hypothetical protein
MTDIDHLLARISACPLDPRLAALDGPVFAGLDQARAPVIDRAGLGAVTALALMLGVMASALPATPISATPARADPLRVDALAPSTLLADAR